MYKNEFSFGVGDPRSPIYMYIPGARVIDRCRYKRFSRLLLIKETHPSETKDGSGSFGLCTTHFIQNVTVLFKYERSNLY